MSVPRSWIKPQSLIVMTELDFTSGNLLSDANIPVMAMMARNILIDMNTMMPTTVEKTCLRNDFIIVRD